MATKLDYIKWKLHSLKHKTLLKYGLKKGLVRPYDEETIENLRNVYYGGIPASIILLDDVLCQGQCYDRALLMAMGCGDDDFQLVDADIDGISLQLRYIDQYCDTDFNHYGNHCFVERKMKDGKTWVYDTTWGLCYEKNLYYAIHRPKITKINDKDATINYIEYQEIKNADVERDKFIVPTILPMIETHVEHANSWYKERLKFEISHFKKKIDFDGLVKARDEDMQQSFQLEKILKNKPNHQ